MSIRSNGSGDNATHNAAITIGTGSFSCGGWFKPISDRPTDIIMLHNAALSEFIGAFIGASVLVPLLASTGGGTDDFGTGLTADTWYGLVFGRTGDTLTLRIFEDSPTMTLLQTLSKTLTASYNFGSTLDNLTISQAFAGEWADGEYRRLLLDIGDYWTDTECRTELSNTTAQTGAGTVWGDYDINNVATGLADQSGNGRDLTNTGLIDGASDPSQLAGDVTEVSDADTAGFDEATTESADSSPRDDASFAEATTATAETTTPVDTGSVVEATAQTARATSPYDSGALVDTAEVGVSDIVHERTESAPLTDRVTQRYDQERDDTAALLDESDALTIFDRSPLSVLLDRVSQRVDWVLSDTMGVEEVADRFAPVELTASDTAGWAATTSQQADEDPIEDFPGVEATSESVTITTPIDELLGFNDFGEQGLGGDRQDAETFGWGDSASLAVVLAETDTMIATQVATRTGTAILHGTLDADAAMAPRLTGTVTLEV